MTTPVHRLIALAASLAAPALVLGCLLFGPPAPAQAANVVVSHCTAAELHAAIITATASNGGLVTFNCPGGSHTFTVTQTQVLSRDVTLDGGGVITISGGDSVRIFSVPAAQKATLANLTLTHGHASDGGALSVAGVFVARHVNFVSNVGASSGGALAVIGLGQATISNSTFSANQSTFGGAIETQASLVLAGDEFDDNSTPFPILFGTPGGGALVVTPSGVADIEQTTFFSNTANNGGLGVGGAVANGGALTVVDTLFNQNHALSDGGAIFNNGGLAQINHSTFVRNTALGEGGAISNTKELVIDDSTLVSNTAGVSGGAFATAGDGGGLEQTLLFNNFAPSGGALRNHTRTSHFAIMDSTFYSNTALTGGGGAVLNDGSMFAINTTLVANAAPNASGAALLNTGPNTPTATLYETTIVSNSAASGGAALRRNSGQILLGDSLVAFNAPDNCQGAITREGANLQFQGLGPSCGAGFIIADPRLGPLQDNGGPRLGVFNLGLPTLLPLTGSPAIDAGVAAACPYPIDERGFARLGLCDLGAVERVFPVQLPVVQR